MTPITPPDLELAIPAPGGGITVSAVDGAVHLSCPQPTVVLDARSVDDLVHGLLEAVDASR